MAAYRLSYVFDPQLTSLDEFVMWSITAFVVTTVISILLMIIVFCAGGSEASSLLEFTLTLIGTVLLLWAINWPVGGMAKLFSMVVMTAIIEKRRLDLLVNGVAASSACLRALSLAAL